MSKIPTIEESEQLIGDELTFRQEAFCRAYALNSRTFGNGTLAYAEAYGYDLGNLSREEERDPETNKIIQKSEYHRALAVCGVQGSYLLRKPKIDERIMKLLNESMTEEAVDAELMKVIKQGKDSGAKIRAINEFNKLKGRIVERVTNTVKIEEPDQEKKDTIQRIFNNNSQTG